MKIIHIIIFTLIITGCVSAKTTTTKLDIAGDPLPAISHIIEMKITGDTLFFVYETDYSHGQHFLRRAVLDRYNDRLDVSCDMGKTDGTYYVSYMPYPFISESGVIGVIEQDNSEVYTIKNDSVFVRTKQYILDNSSTIPFPLSLYVKDIFMIERDKYVFIGREPSGGRQYAMESNLATSKIDVIRQINVNEELQAWMPNMGELVYLRNHKRLAFAYYLHPIIEIFDISGNIIKSVRISEDTFDKRTLDEADFDTLNILHTIDVTYTDDYIYVLHLACRHAESFTTIPTIIKIDWNGNIIDRYSTLPALSNIAAIDDNSLIGWNGKSFIKLDIE